MKYNNLENVKSNILDYVKENKKNIRDEQFNFDALYDDLFINDAITGNYCNVLGQALEEVKNDILEILREED